MAVYQTNSEQETMALGAQLARSLTGGSVVAMFGGLGMGKTAFVRGMAQVLAPGAAVTSPTFALVHEYGGNPPLCHFDMYRVENWEDLYSTGFLIIWTAVPSLRSSGVRILRMRSRSGAIL